MNKDKLIIIKGNVVLINNEIPLKKSIIIKNGIVIDIKEFDYQIKEGEQQYEVINIKDDLIIMGGLVNSNVHVVDDHHNNKDKNELIKGFENVTNSAAAGGITTIIDGTPFNSIPATTSFENLQLKIKSINDTNKLRVDVGLLGGIVPGNTLEINKMILEGGVVGFKTSKHLVKDNDIQDALNEMKKIHNECGGRDVVIMVNNDDQVEMIKKLSNNDCDDVQTCILLNSNGDDDDDDDTINSILSYNSKVTPTTYHSKEWSSISLIKLSLPTIWTQIKKRNITLNKLSEYISDVPAKLVGLNDRKGSIAIGRDADFVIWNPNETFIPSQGGDNDDQQLTGVIYETFLRGQSIFKKDNDDSTTNVNGKLLIPTKIHTNPTFPNPKLPSIELLNSLPENSFFDCVHLLFEAAPPLANALYEKRPFSSYKKLIDSADSIIKSLSLDDKIQVINAHPRIGLNPDQIKKSSSISFREQGLQNEQSSTIDQSILDTYKTLTKLNDEYESKFGFKFVVFVNGRSKQQIIPILEERLNNNSKEFELNKGLSEMIEISNSRLLKL